LSTTEKLRRRKAERKATDPVVIRVAIADRMGNVRWITADLADCSEFGIGVSLRSPLTPGSTIQVRGKLGDQHGSEVKAEVMWCVEDGNGTFKAGLELLDKRRSTTASTEERPSETRSKEVLPLDFYEVMQLSPNADAETITRVYRILASRYHPDNSDTGDPEMFVQLTEAYQTLSDPEKRAGYDAQHRETKRLHWKIFDQASATTGVDAEKRKRQGILDLLHSMTLQDPEHAAISIRSFEDLLGCPREHLEAALWYLRGKGYIQRGDNGRYTITVQGFDKAEEQGILQYAKSTHLLEPASS
jgi:hypothetical protein